MTLAVLEPISLPAFAQTPSRQLSTAQCAEIEIQKHIQQLSKAEPTTFDALVACQSKAVPALIQTLDTKDENARIIIIAALGQIRSSATPAEPFLNQLLIKDTSHDVRSMAAHALKQIGKDPVPVLITAFKDENEEVRSGATAVLVQIGKDAVPTLIMTLRNENGEVRYRSAVALGQIGGEAKDAVPTLTKALKDTDSKVRSGAAFALEQINNSIDNSDDTTAVDQPQMVVQRTRQVTFAHVNDKPPVICRIPAIRTILKWKCPKVSQTDRYNK